MPNSQEILDVQKNGTGNGWWVILECGHWYKWTGELPPKIGTQFNCPRKEE